MDAVKCLEGMILGSRRGRVELDSLTELASLRTEAAMSGFSKVNTLNFKFKNSLVTKTQKNPHECEPGQVTITSYAERESGHVYEHSLRGSAFIVNY